MPRSFAFLAWVLGTGLSYIPSSQDWTNLLPARNFEGFLHFTRWIPEKRNTESNAPDFPSKETHSKGYGISEHSICNACHTNQIKRGWLSSAIFFFPKNLKMSCIKMWRLEDKIKIKISWPNPSLISSFLPGMKLPTEIVTFSLKVRDLKMKAYAQLK